MREDREDGPVIVAEAVGRTLAALGVDTVFGVVGSGNFHVTNALIADGARFVAARHEAGAATMADAWARVSGRVGVLSVHQGPGLTNAMTGIAEAAKSRTPLLVLAAETTAERSNFWVDQAALARAVGATPLRIRDAGTAAGDVALAWRTARDERRTVVLSMPLEIQSAEYQGRDSLGIGELRMLRSESRSPDDERVAIALTSADAEAMAAALEAARRPAFLTKLAAHPVSGTELAALAEALTAARRPVFIAGRGAKLSGADEPLRKLAAWSGALLATSAVARGLFLGDPFDLDVSGGFATPLAAELIAGADLIVGWGCALNMWTLRHGALVADGATVAQVDLDPDAIGAHRSVDLGVVGDVSEVAHGLKKLMKASPGYRSPELAARLARERQWRDVPYEDTASSTPGDRRIDPRTLSIALDDLLPRERTVAVDSGNFMGYPAMYLGVPDADGLVFTQAFQSIGLGLATAIGAALARPDRLTVAALGDGGALMSIADLDTAVRLKLGLLIVVYNDEAYGAEVHHFGPGGHPLGAVTFPETDIAAIGRGFGCEGHTVREPADLAAVADWLFGPRDRPLLVDAKVTRDQASWWLEEAFRGH